MINYPLNMMMFHFATFNFQLVNTLKEKNNICDGQNMLIHHMLGIQWVQKFQTFWEE